MRHIIATLALIAAGALGSASCTVIDANDKQDVSNKISAMPADVQLSLRIMATKINAQKWLSHKPTNDRVGELKCFYDIGDGEGWQPILTNDTDLLVDFMLQCLNGGLNRTYVSCGLTWGKSQIPLAKQALKELFTTNPMLKVLVPDVSTVKFDCRYEWDWRYDPIGGEVPQECVDPKAVNNDDIINALVVSPHPPPGFPTEELIPLLPYLCPLDVGPGWGCPSSPTNPGGGVGASTGGGG
jgi:hypothetical protein